jgi:hypothetical protein
MAALVEPLRWLLTRRRQPARWVFLATTIVITLFALVGGAYGAFIPLFPLIRDQPFSRAGTGRAPSQTPHLELPNLVY